ncbi:MAG: hypothetical protein PHQ47_03555 [Candidatus Portnoybacteria bacterium]|nr:hypothetical protein [Candidatus Portnoybacteria bacterium]
MNFKEIIGEELYDAGPFILAALVFVVGVIFIGAKIFDTCV